MGTAIATLSPTEESSKIELIKKMVAKDCTKDELELFLYTCKRTGLDPMVRQIYAVKRSGKMSIQTGIDGYRLIADRTGKLAGISDYQFDSEDGKNPKKASVTVRKLLDGGVVADFTATARWGEYQAGGPMWARMPYLMLGKCAEALALRKAFPADLSGVYTSDEMAQADNAVQGEQVYAEVERQKSSIPTTARVLAAPPELDWSYNKTTGILICRIVSAVKRSKKAGGDYLTVEVNGQVGGKRPDVLTYFADANRDAILSAIGKGAKFETEVSGDFANIIKVLEIDGVRVEASESDQAEQRARLMASVLDFTEDELNEMFTRYCGGNWSEVIVKLQAEQVRRDGLEG